MNKRLVVLLLAVICLQTALSQDFPPIDHGKLELNYISQNITNSAFNQIMTAFGQKIDTSKLESLLINLKGNFLTNIDPITVLGNYAKLNHLELVFVDNNITSINSLSQTLKKLTGLKELILSFGNNNYIIDHSSLANILSSLTNLDQLFLYFGQSNVQKVDHDLYITNIASLVKLNFLYLGFDNNQIGNCDTLTNLKSLVLLTEFDISYVFTGLQVLPDMYFIRSYTNLQNLTMIFENNQVAGIPDLLWIVALPLQKIIFNFGINQITDVSGIESIAEIKTLQILMLYLPQNDIQDLYPFTYFKDMPNLQILLIDLQSNNIQSITYLSQFGKNQNLESMNINIMSNYLSDYDAFDDFSNSTSLRVAIIDAEYNIQDNFTYLNSFNSLSKLEAIQINNQECDMTNNYVVVQDQGNSWVCSNCDQNCQKCFGPGSEECLSCKTSEYLLKNQCYKECPEGYHKNTSDHTCEKDSLVLISVILAFLVIIVMVVLILLCK